MMFVSFVKWTFVLCLSKKDAGRKNILGKVHGKNYTLSVLGYRLDDKEAMSEDNFNRDDNH